MASPNTSWTDILTTTLYARQKTLADNVTNSNAFLKYLKRGGRRKPFSGGVSIVEHLEYAESTNAQYYSGYEPVAIAAQELFTAAEFSIKQAACAVTISGLEQLQNSADAQMLDLMEKRIGNAEKTMMNLIATGVYSDGTGTSSKQIGGLQLLVADVPTSGVVGGIDRASYSFWQNYYLGVSTSGSGSSITATNIQVNMNTVMNNVTRGTDRPTVILMDTLFYSKFEASLQAIQRITQTDTGMLGFKTLEYAGVPVILDGGHGGACPASHGYFINTDYLSYRPHSDREFTPLDPDRFATNQDAMVKLIGWAGNLTLSNAFLQGVMTNA